MSNPSLRPLLPTKNPRPPPSAPLPKRKRATLACDACRTKRNRCDGGQPCVACQSRDSMCTYATPKDTETRSTVLRRQNMELREEVATLRDLIDHLKSMPVDAVHDALQRLQAGFDPAVVVQTFKGEVPGPRLSEQETAQAILPPIHSSKEFELLVRHPIAYPLLDLCRKAQATGDTLVHSGATIISNVFPSNPSNPIEDHPRIQPGEDEFVLQNRDSVEGEPDNPEPPPQYFDARLTQLNIDFWTSVSISNTTAASVISDFLKYQNSTWCVFHDALFVRDLVELRFDYCSPFMVSSLLAIASQSHASYGSDSLRRISHDFENEAEKLFGADSAPDTLPTISGLCLLYVSMAGHSNGLKGLNYLSKAVQIAERMNLLGVKDPVGVRVPASVETLAGTSQTIWGLFNLTVHLSRFFLDADFIFDHPPKLPFPEFIELSKNMGNNAGHNDSTTSNTSTGATTLHTAFCKLWVITHEIILVYRDREGSVASLAFAYSKFFKILSLTDSLPKSSCRSKESCSPTLVFHMYIHLTIMDLFRPFVSPDKQHGFRSYIAHAAPPASIFAASVHQLKGLLFQYTHICSPAYYSLMSSGAIVYAANAIMNDLHDPERRAYVYFYVQMGLRTNYRSLTDNSLAIVALAHDKGIITSTEAACFAKQVGHVGERGVGSGYIIDVERAGSDAVAANVDSLAERFQEITLFGEFTEGVV
ncbi:hypothetical protein B0J11DRAFT_140351 [Dendryphion nanum]|uniref:Zn(2)-C6 fungal-type domain-containing protein n=1 Tax=Dendryphion nanum TaxID=256645 RepID=A0A9P9IAI9_9PLEO|nr:hypothetical protein B0J11DRAFT_140351 [Dendryphion nanum]